MSRLPALLLIGLWLAPAGLASSYDSPSLTVDVSAGSAAPVEQTVAGAPLKSFRGTVWTAYDVDPNTPPESLPFIQSRVWARDDLTRYESYADGRKTIGIQRGPIMYSFVEGEPRGVKIRLRGGLGALGLVRQFELVRSLGKATTSKDVQGVIYDGYIFHDDATGETVSTRFSRETWIPDAWLGSLPNGNVTLVYYENMEANIDVPDETFRLPDGVEFVSDPALISPPGQPQD